VTGVRVEAVGAGSPASQRGEEDIMAATWRNVVRAAIVTVLLLPAGVLAAAPARAATERPVNWFDVTLRVPWKAARLPDGTVCPGGRIDFEPSGDGAHGLAVRNGFLYTVRPVSEADVTGDGRIDTVVALACARAADEPGSFLEPGQEWLFLYTVRHGKPVVRDYLTSTELAANARWTVFSATARPGAVDVTQQVRTPEGTFLLVDRTFRWTRQGFVADRPLPFFPEADAQP
jgi:hypothetical protein